MTFPDIETALTSHHEIITNLDTLDENPPPQTKPRWNVIPRLHGRANIEQTSSRPDGTSPPGSNVDSGLAHSWSSVL